MSFLFISILCTHGPTNTFHHSSPFWDFPRNHKPGTFGTIPSTCLTTPFSLCLDMPWPWLQKLKKNMFFFGGCLIGCLDMFGYWGQRNHWKSELHMRWIVNRCTINWSLRIWSLKEHMSKYWSWMCFAVFFCGIPMIPIISCRAQMPRAPQICRFIPLLKHGFPLWCLI